jgi:hypothetical protein
MRLQNMTQRRRAKLDLVEKLINRGWRRTDIAKRMGYSNASRVGQLVYELRVEGKVDPQRPDQVAARAEFVKVLVLCGIEERRRM